MRRTIVFMSVLALALAGCGGGESSCAAIVDDGIDLFQDVIDELDGLALSDVQNDPFEDAEYERRVADLEERTTDAGCTDEEMTTLFTERVGALQAGESNPAGQFFITILTAAVEEGEFGFGE